MHLIFVVILLVGDFLCFCCLSGNDWPASRCSAPFSPAALHPLDTLLFFTLAAREEAPQHGSALSLGVRGGRGGEECAMASADEEAAACAGIRKNCCSLGAPVR